MNFRSMTEKIHDLSIVKELVELLTVENSCHCYSVSDLCSAATLFHFTDQNRFHRAIVQQTKLIKAYLHSTMSQRRLNSLTVPTIENDETSSINAESVVSSLVSVKETTLRKIVMGHFW